MRTLSWNELKADFAKYIGGIIWTDDLNAGVRVATIVSLTFGDHNLGVHTTNTRELLSPEKSRPDLFVDGWDIIISMESRLQEQDDILLVWTSHLFARIYPKNHSEIQTHWILIE